MGFVINNGILQSYENDSGSEKAVIPDGVEKIGIYAFFGHSELTSVTIPASVTESGWQAFEGCSNLTEINVLEGNEHFCSEDGVMFSKDKTVLVRCPCGKPGEYIIPDGTAETGREAFSGCKSLTSVTFPDSLRKTEWHSFSGCTSLTEINIPENNSYFSFDNGMLFNRDKTVLICCLESRSGICTVPGGVEIIDTGAFYGCKELNSVTLPESVNKIRRMAFYNCAGLESVNMPDSISVIQELAFSECTSLKSVNIPSGITEIEEGLFENCQSLTSVHIPEGVKIIGENAFSQCESLTDIIIPESVEEIKEWAFSQCTQLEINVPDSVKTTGSSSFSGCKYTNAENAYLGFVIKEGVLETYKYDYYREDVVIPDGTVKIADFAFSECQSPDTIYIPGSVKEIAPLAFSECTFLQNTEVSADNECYSSENGILLSKDGTVMLYCPEGRQDSFEIPAGVKKIREYTFVSCIGLKRIIINSAAVQISSISFVHCTGLDSIDVPESNEYYSSENGVLFNKDKTVLVRFPEGKSGSYVIPDSVKKIGDYAFNQCEKLVSVTIPGSVEKIGREAFYGCENLRSADIPASVREIGISAFRYCKNLELDIPGSVKETGINAFENCKKVNFLPADGK